MGWIVDYLEKLSLIDYANRQRHKTEHPELYATKRKRNAEPSTIEKVLRDTQDMHHENMMQSIRERYKAIAEILKKAEEKKAKEKKQSGEKQD